MKRIALLFFAFLALPYFARAQTAQLYYAFTAQATGGVADTSLAPQVDALNVRISGISTTTSWTAQIQTSPDQATWTNCGTAVTATSAASASGGACTPSGAAFTRVLITAGTGGGSVVGALIGTCSLCQVSSSGGITLTTTGTSGPATLIGGVLNVPQYSSEGAVLLSPGGNQIITYSTSGPSTLTVANPNAGSSAYSGYDASNGTDIFSLLLAGTGTALPGAAGFVLSNATAPLSFTTGGGPILFNAPNTNISGGVNYAIDSGAANAYVVTPPSCVTPTHDGITINFKAANASTGASTLDYCPGSALPFVKNGSTALTTGDILAGAQYSARYNAAVPNWQLLNSSLVGGGGSLPTATAAGQGIYATGAGTTYLAANISRLPVEFSGATPYTTEAAAEAGPDDTAHFQTAVSAMTNGVVTCQAGMYYHVEGPVNFASYEGLVGTANMAYGGLCNLVTNSASTHVLSAVGTSGTDVIGITLQNLAIYRSTAGTGTSAGVYVSFVLAAIVDNVFSYDSIYDFYRHVTPVAGGAQGHWDHLQANWILGETSGTYYGFYDDSADGNEMDSTFLSNSQTACNSLGTGAISYGHILSGTAPTDDDSFNFSSNTCTYGQVVNFTGSGSGANCSDIHFWNSTHDNFVTNAFQVNGCTAAQTGSVEISGGWAVAGARTTSATGAIYILNSSGVSVNHVQIGAHSNFTAEAPYGVNISGGSGNSVVGNTFLNQPEPFNLTGTTTGNTISSNTFINASGNAFNGGQVGSSATYNTVTNNTWTTPSGTVSTGFYFGGNYNTYVGNTCSSGVTTCVNDSGTGNGLYVYGMKSAPSVVTSGGPASYLGIGPNTYQGWSNGTPSDAFSLGYDVPGGSITTNAQFSVFGGSSWHEAWNVNSSTYAMTFDGAVSAPSFGAGSSPPAVTYGTGGGFGATEGTAPSAGAPAAGVDAFYADSTAHCIEYSANGGTFTCLNTGKVHSCEVVFGGTGTSNVLQAGDDAIANNSCYNEIGVTETITGVYCKSDASSAAPTVNPTFGAAGTGTSVLSGALTCGTSNAYLGTTTIASGSLTVGTGIDPVMASPNGTNIHMLIVYTVPN